MSIFNDVAQAMQSIVGKETDQLAKETGFISHLSTSTAPRKLTK